MPPESNEVVLRKAGLTTRIAAIVLGPSAQETQIEEFAIDLMAVPEGRLRAILTALPGGESLDERCLPDRTTAWERLIKPKVRL